MSAPAKRRGFTLVELMIAMLLLGIVLSLVYGAFAQISGRTIELRDALNEQQELRLLTRMIADDLQAAQWLTNTFSPSSRTATGIVARLEFIDTSPFTEISLHASRPARFYRKVEPLNDPHLHEIGYFVRQNKETGQLNLVRREDFYVDDDLEHGGVVVVVSDNVAQFKVEFLAPGGADRVQEDWQERWDSTQRDVKSRLPVAIRLTVATKDKSDIVRTETVEFNLPSVVKL